MESCVFFLGLGPFLALRELGESNEKWNEKTKKKKLSKTEINEMLTEYSKQGHEIQKIPIQGSVGTYMKWGYSLAKGRGKDQKKR